MACARVLIAGVLMVASTGHAAKSAKDFVPVDSPPGDNKAMKNQVRLIDAAEELQEIAKSLTGFGSIEVDPFAPELKLFWKASVSIPSSVLGKIAEFNSGGIPSVTYGCPFSNSELLSAKYQLLDGLANEGVEFRSLGPAPGGQGLRVEVPGGGVNNVWTSDAYLEAVTYLQNVAAFPTEPVVIAIGPSWLLAALREDDGPLFWGGARILINGNRQCSVAFSAGNLLGKYLLTAGHCLNTNGVDASTGAGTLVLGPSAQVDAPGPNGFALDLARIDMNLDEVNGWVWNRGLGNDAAAAPVDGTGSNFVGMLICTSGSFSGELCDGQVEMVNQAALAFDTNGGGVIDELIFALQLSGTNLAGEGDSGGPVYSYRVDLRHIRARGIMSVISTTDQLTNEDFTVACTRNINPGRVCSRRIGYSTIQNAMTNLDVWIENSVGF